jgi:hypothetical protein
MKQKNKGFINSKQVLAGWKQLGILFVSMVILLSTGVAGLIDVDLANDEITIENTLVSDGNVNTTSINSTNVNSTNIYATTNSGLTMYDDGGNLGLFIEDSTGDVGVNFNAPKCPLHVTGDYGDVYEGTCNDEYVALFEGGTFSSTKVGMFSRTNAYLRFGNRTVDNKIVFKAQVGEGEAGILDIYVAGGYRFEIDDERTTIKDVLNLNPVSSVSSPQEGDIYYDSDDDMLKCYNGTAWNNLY